MVRPSGTAPTRGTTPHPPPLFSARATPSHPLFLVCARHTPKAPANTRCTLDTETFCSMLLQHAAAPGPCVSAQPAQADTHAPARAAPQPALRYYATLPLLARSNTRPCLTTRRCLLPPSLALARSFARSLVRLTNKQQTHTLTLFTFSHNKHEYARARPPRKTRARPTPDVRGPSPGRRRDRANTRRSDAAKFPACILACGVKNVCVPTPLMAMGTNCFCAKEVTQCISS